MTDSISPEELGFDDSSLAFINTETVDSGTLSDPATSGDDSSQPMFGAAAGWDLPQAPAFDAYDVDTTIATTSMANEALLTSTWQFPAFPELAGMASGLDVNAAFDAANVRESLRTSHIPLEKRREPTLLTAEAQERLRNIAMPPNLRYKSPKSTPSPTSGKTGQTSSPNSTDETKKVSRKRKVSSEPEDDDDMEDDDKPIKKTAHNMIEKRYRNNINDKIAALRDSVPSLRIMSKSAKGEDTSLDREELHGLTPAHKLNKATVLSKATEYIQHLEKRNCRLQEENNAMQARITAFEKLFMAGAMNGSISSVPQPPQPIPYAVDGSQQLLRSPVSDGSNERPVGMIQVPEDMRRILAAQMAAGQQPYPVPSQPYQEEPHMISQQQIQQHPVPQHQGVWANTAPYFGKLMVGSLAGLMILEAIREDEQSTDTPEGRGLFAIPMQFVRTASKAFNFNMVAFHTPVSIKMLLFLGLFLWVFIPSLFRPKKKDEDKCTSSLEAGSSPASSIHVRRQAWLTSVQTVWVPRHNFFLEAAALIAKTIKLSLRNLIGPGGYQALTGFTEEQEVARVKAWSIALDSQLAGGDVEICKSRLVLTLLASGTLPDTPIRLMLKALHIRVLLWEINRSPLQFGLANVIACKLARTQWNGARRLNQMLKQIRDDPEIPHEDELPDHLAVLAELECDEVLSKAVVQRAHNLAFNRHTDHLIESVIDGMDSVVSDVYISSPMDAVAAWWSMENVHRILSDHLNGNVTPPDAVDAELELAILATPVGSIAMLRASLARAILVSKNRGANIASAIQALGTERIESPFSESRLIIGSGAHASNKKLLLPLQCSVTMAHLSRSDHSVSMHANRLQTIRSLASLASKASMSLLGFAAVIMLVERAMACIQDSDEDIANEKAILEALSNSLRNWMTGKYGIHAGLENEIREKAISRCVAASKGLAATTLDAGYVSMSEEEKVKYKC